MKYGEYKKTCKTCGTIFFVRAYRKKSAKYCSYDCSHEGRKEGNYFDRVCKYCGKDFKAKRAEVKKSANGVMFCSRKCWRFGTVNPRLQARARAKCDRCGWKKFPAILEVHHKDRNKENDYPTNPALLCPTCHGVIHYLAKDGPYTWAGDTRTGKRIRRTIENIKRETIIKKLQCRH